jgi:nucleoside-diphosphate-sugar epimerase
VQGTQRILAAAQQAGARRFIHIGSEAALSLRRRWELLKSQGDPN